MGFWMGMLVGGLLVAGVAALASAAYTRLLKLHARRDWRTPVPIGGEQFYIVPEQEYRALDRVRNRLEAVASNHALLNGTGVRVEKRPPWADRPDFDMSTDGRPLRPGS